MTLTPNITVNSEEYQDLCKRYESAVRLVTALKRMRKVSKPVRKALQDWNWNQLSRTEKFIQKDCDRFAVGIAKHLSARSPWLDLFDGKKNLNSKRKVTQ